MIRRASLALVVGLVALGCVRKLERGRIGLLSSHAVALPMRVVAPEVEGESCAGSPSGDYIALALADALAKAPGANALANASIEQSPFLCFVVRGTAVEMGAAGAAPPATPATPPVAPTSAASP